MHVTSRDTAQSNQEWRDFLRERDFGQLVVHSPEIPVPMVVPTPYVYATPSGAIEFHLDRDNPAWDVVATNPVAVFTVLDAHTYIPTYWNARPGADPAWSPPTSYYAVVQAIGRITVIEEEEAIANLLTRQLQRMQPEGGHGPIEPGSTGFGRFLNAVLGARLEIVDVRAKFKFGGDKTAAHRRAIADNLERRGGCMDLRAREHMLRRCQEVVGREQNTL